MEKRSLKAGSASLKNLDIAVFPTPLADLSHFYCSSYSMAISCLCPKHFFFDPYGDNCVLKLIVCWNLGDGSGKGRRRMVSVRNQPHILKGMIHHDRRYNCHLAPAGRIYRHADRSSRRDHSYLARCDTVMGGRVLRGHPQGLIGPSTVAYLIGSGAGGCKPSPRPAI